MASLEGFYSVLTDTRDENSAEVQVRIHADHAIYAGHFPDQPIAPGAALTQMVIDEAQRLIGGQQVFVGAKQIKFLSVLNPNVTGQLVLRFSFSTRDSQQQFACTGVAGDTIFFKINGAFG